MLFVCLGNSCRSQMAEALARHQGSDVMEPASAGVAALGVIAPGTRAVLAERGVRTDGQYSKTLSQSDCEEADLIVNMAGRPADAVLRGYESKSVDSEVADPYGEDLELYRRICEEIDDRGRQLADGLRKDASPAPRR
ncbi:MAG TPA: low molecular weight phosphatase family protein [Candidatus Acidoferrales bacterium]|nr:low molecular weight phosphatase family protein [Candidatus Acidoferrales bacterium]